MYGNMPWPPAAECNMITKKKKKKKRNVVGLSEWLQRISVYHVEVIVGCSQLRCDMSHRIACGRAENNSCELGNSRHV